MSMSLYQVLNVPIDATSVQIKSSYRRLALQYHPDKQQQQQSSSDHEDRFKEISRAYEVLSNDRLKDIYDRHGDVGLEMAEHMGDMSFILTKEGESLIVTSLCSIALLVGVVIVFFTFVALKSDNSIGWQYSVVFIPLWILDGIAGLFVYSRYLKPSLRPNSSSSAASDPVDDIQSTGTDSKDDDDYRNTTNNNTRSLTLYERVLGLLRTFQFMLIIWFQLMIVLRADGYIFSTVTTVFIPWFLFEATLFITKTISLIVSSVSSASSWKSLLLSYVAGLRYFAIRLCVAILICIQMDSGGAVGSWFVVFSPLYFGTVMVLLMPSYRYQIFKRRHTNATTEQLQSQFSSALAQTVLVTCVSILFLVLISLLAARLNAVSSGVETFSMSVILIPLFIVLGILFCCTCCCLPCAVISGGLQPDLEAQQSNPSTRRRIEFQ